VRRAYWVPTYRWQLEEWLRDWAKRTGNPLPGLRKKNKRELYALYFSIMEEHTRRKRSKMAS